MRCFTARVIACAFLTLSLLFLAPPLKAATPPPLYLTTHSALRESARHPTYYSTNGVTPIVLLDGNGYNVFTPGWDWSGVSDVQERISGPFYVALWADNVARDEMAGGSTLVPWDDDTGWQIVFDNLANLRAHCAGRPVLGVVWDSEIYTETPGNNGGWMPADAWRNGPRARERGLGVNAALDGLVLAQYVLVDNVNGRDGWRDFSKGMHDEDGSDLLLDSGPFLVGSSTKALDGYGVLNLPGRTIKDGSFKGSVPDKPFWIYPWNGDAATDLSLFSTRWL